MVGDQMGGELESSTLYVIVTLGAAIIGAMIQAFGPSLWEMLPRSGPKFPFLKGEWDAIWYVDEGSKEKLYIKNTLKLTQRGRSVRGVGRDASGHGDYVLKGRFNSHGVVTMAYEYKDAAMAGSDIES
jgi:hypothetical protein